MEDLWLRLEDRHSARIEILWCKARDCERRLTARITEIRAVDREFAALQEPIAVDLETIRGALAEGTMLVEYYRARGTIYACLVTRESLELVRLGDAAQLDDLLRVPPAFAGAGPVAEPVERLANLDVRHAVRPQSTATARTSA